MRFLHCSDVHITQEYFNVPVRKLGWRRAIALAELSVGGRAKAYAQAKQTLSRIVSEVGARGVDHLICSGDLTAYATEAEFQGAREALNPLATDKRLCTVIPGNHDTYTPGAVADGRFERYFGHLIESDLPEFCREGPYPFVRLLGEEVAVIGLRSARVPLMPGFSFGEIRAPQLAGLRELVRDSRLAGRAVLVVVHHAPLNPAGRPDKPLHGLRDAKALFELLPGPRFAVLHGHIHRRYTHPATATTPHTFGAGSSTQAGHEGYWVIETGDGVVKGGTLHLLPGAGPLAAHVG